MKLGIDHIPYEWIEQIISLSAERIVVVDRDGVIRYISDSYCDFLGTTVEYATGRYVGEIIENTRMHIVARTGQAELASVQPINGSEMIANRYPLIVDGELVGAFGTVMFRTPDEWRDYNRKIQPLIQELKFYKTKFENELKSKYSFDDIIGNSPSFMAVKQFAERISVSQSGVLLLGESGTGKELFAHAIHNNSTRAAFPFVPINCASIPDHLLESELFGYEEGAFTGAKRGGKKGQLQVANYGTIFLDEIGDMPLAMQSKLLRVLQEKEIQRIGSQKTIPIDVRVIAATHRDLEKMVLVGEFRSDLYYRLNVIKIEIPSLRRRTEDIVPIALNLLKKLEKKFNRQGIELSKKASERLKLHSWPGNIRELENVLERALNVLDGKMIDLFHLPLYLRDIEPVMQETRIHIDSICQEKREELKSLKEEIALAEKNTILRAINASGGNKVEAARLLQISKTTLYDKCKLHNIK
ncbi:sigma-54 interaction domain-containing protein [Neobacillus terrae]|uniref:sigma-54 interaction domain-containing protein n=1 Tax=Neobacillus terrae TaxID=3034837 RepID=UPI00140811ED|nr:sigma 54-interacting transcriptional regulator [Neobacillus terrae]NHM29521.1 sigma 54-interacting transcriptional regulator [Neobacillus terrae]